MKTKFLKLFLGTIVLLLTISCKVEPEAIEFGKDQCDFCKMNIVDKTHAAQFVTAKGKQFKFDAIECVVNYVGQNSEEKIAVLLVADYGNPGEMTDAETAAYLISTEIKSPMGANLSAFSLKNTAEEYQQKHSGEIYTWETLKQKLSDK
ncbi:nitrous oxide reductase accessory protein NosL [Lutibacter sp.]|uniref:nitrous oxide reductase accessory protein NosL n=1 Tax=Lutibacter sp. TaxID=1925666 RepID=UPI0035668CF0